MTIAIDCRMIDASGIGVYLRGCLPWFLRSENFFVLIGNSKELSDFYSSKNTEIIDCKIKPFSLNELFFFPLKISKRINSADVFYSPFFNIPGGIKTSVFTTIHDIIFPDMPELTSKIGLAIRMWFYRRAHKKSKKIFTVSQFSKSRIEHHLKKNKSSGLKPVIVTHSAIQEKYLDYRREIKNIQKKEIIIFIGNIKKHKGLDILLDAFIQAKNEGLPHQLLIIGSKENFRSSDNIITKKIESAGDEKIIFAGFVSEEALMEHLSSASLLVQPSLYEGFCLPPLEAMVLKTKALISDIPVLKEIYKDFPVTFFKAGEINDLKEKMTELLTCKPVDTVELSEHLMNKYTFKKTADIILNNL